MANRKPGVVAFDTETALIRPALCAPPLVCVTWQTRGDIARIVHHTDAEPIIRSWLESDSIIVGHHVQYDLMVVCERFPELRPLVFKAYAENRVTDTKLRQQLLDIAGGVYRGRMGAKGQWVEHKYDLEALAKRMAGMYLQKDGWRLSYGEFLDTPFDQWPARAREVQAAARPRVVALDARIAQTGALKQADVAKALIKERDGLKEMIAGDPSRASEYPLDDARATLAVYEAQEAHAAFLDDQFRQARGHWALGLSSAWGLRTDPEAVERLRAATTEAYNALEEDMIQLGLVRSDKKRTRDTKAAKARMIRVCREEGTPLRRTEGHLEEDAEKTKCRDAAGNKLPPGHDDCAEHVCLDADACEATGDEVLKNYAEISTLKKVLSNDIEVLLKGVRYPVHTSYGMAETGRTTSSKPNIQNFRRMVGIRECFVPRPGMVFGAVDYPSLESFTWAQCCKSWLGHSTLAEALINGTDPHLFMAAHILRIPYAEAKVRHDAGDQEVDDIRQLSKVANFGLPGGMGAETFLVSAKAQLKPEVVLRLGLDLPRAEKLMDEWRAAWPEAKPYFDRIKSFGPPYPQKYRATIETLFTKRKRGNTGYCAACNTGFQALGVDIGKEAMWRVACEQYVDQSSPLFNTRTAAFVHDEIVIEAPEATAHEAVNRLADVMLEAANMYLPDVPMRRAKLQPVLMRRWSKKAKPVFDSSGRLIPWDMKF